MIYLHLLSQFLQLPHIFQAISTRFHFTKTALSNFFEVSQLFKVLIDLGQC